MPRKRRIEFAGAVYHVIGKENYRKDLLAQRGSGQHFEETLIETVDRCEWRVFAYVVMSNHFHLAFETPEPNLVEGMRCYRDHLHQSEAADPQNRERLAKRYCRGWYIGQEKEKRELAKELLRQNPDVDWELADYRELNQSRWEQIVEDELQSHGKSEQDPTPSARSDDDTPFRGHDGAQMEMVGGKVPAPLPDGPDIKVQQSEGTPTY